MQKTHFSSTIETIIQWYEQGELYQHYQCLTSLSVASDGFDTLRTQPKEFQRCFDRENPSSIYFLAQLIEEVTGESTATSIVYELLAEKQQKRVINPKAYSKGIFFDLFRFLSAATKEQLQRYGHPAGLYFLASDMETQEGTRPSQLYRCVGRKKWLQYLVGEQANGIDWQPRLIDLSISQIDEACSFLLDSYLQDREQFFDVYGSKAGCVLLAQELKISLVNLSPLLSSTEILTAIMDISDEEFEKRFNPRPVYLPLEVVEVVLERLQSAYLTDGEAFYQRYGGRLGVVHLARDLVATGACEYINIAGLSSMLSDGEMVFQLLSRFPDVKIDKKTISSRFSPLYIAMPFAKLEAIIQLLKERYNEDASSFFARYGVEKGVFALVKDLEVGKKMSIHPVRVSDFLADGKELAKLLQIDDRRFYSSWNPSKIRLPIKTLEAVVAFLKERYLEDIEGFLLYGQGGGALLLAKELKRAKINVSLMALCELIKNKALLSSLMEIEKDTLVNFSPKSIQISSKLCNKVLELLQKHYYDDASSFFLVYGGEAGGVIVARELRDAGVRKDANITNLLSLLKNGRLLAKLLNIDDERFLSEWNPRSISFSLSTFERIFSFLKRKYEEDREMFFYRYGKELGIIDLARDISREEKLEIHLGPLRTILSGRLLSFLMGVDDERFLSEWQPTHLPLGLSVLESIKKHLKQEYSRNSDAFFAIYGSPLGVLFLARKLKKKKIEGKVTGLSKLMRNGELVGKLLLIDDDRFYRNWNVRQLFIPLQPLEQIINFLKAEYMRDSDSFFEMYGALYGLFLLYYAFKKNLGVDVGFESMRSCFGDGEFVSLLLGVEDIRFLTDWHPRAFNLSIDDAFAIIDFLRDEYAKGEDRFLSIYASELGEMIIAKEVHERSGHELNLFNIHQLVGKGEMVAFFLGASIERFLSEWQPASKRMSLYSVEERARKWASHLLFFKGLPSLDANLDDSLKEYLSFRWFARQSKLQATLRFFQLFVPEEYEDIERVILTSIEQDRKQLKNIEKEDQFVRSTLVKHAHVGPSSLLRLEELLFFTGQLSYSFSEHIRMSARDKLIEWFAPLLPDYYLSPEHESEAMAILLAAATANDVYAYLKKGFRKCPPFSSYLWKWLSFLNAKVFWKKIPLPFRKNLSKILRFERRFMVENGWEPNVEEISIGTGLSEDAVLRTKEISYWVNRAVIFEDTSSLEAKRLYASVPTS